MTQLILAYNFPAKHLSKLRMAAMKLGVKVRPVEKREYLQSLYPLWDEEKQKYRKETGR